MHRYIKIVFWIIFITFSVSMFSGCNEKRNVKKDLFFEKWKAMAEKSKAGSALGTTLNTEKQEKEKRIFVKEKKAPVKKKRVCKIPEKPLPKDKISMKMYNVEVAVLLRSLARAANLNILINEKVTGLANINIEQAPWDQVFTAILHSNGLTYAWVGDIIRIMTVEDINNDLKLMEAAQNKLSIKKEHELKIKAIQIKEEMAEPLITRVVHIDYADPVKLRENLWEFLKNSRAGADNLISEKDAKNTEMRSSILVDLHTNSLMIQAVSSDLNRLLALIEELDSPIPQILIEAHIVETNSETAKELGIQWGGKYREHGTWGDFVPSAWNYNAGTAAATSGSVNPNVGYESDFNIIPDEGLLTLGFIGDRLDLNMELTALQTEGNLNILSSPSITTLDNHEATIESGKDVPFQTVEDGEVNIEFKKAVLSLKVTPHVINGNKLKLKIETHKDELDFSKTVAGNPTIITKNAETNIVLSDGQTTVIGGLSKETSTNTKSGIPFLKDIPLVGWLFKGKKDTNDMEEVLIFITPHILKQKSQAQKAVTQNDKNHQ